MSPHLPGYLLLFIGFLCFGAGVMSPAWRETAWVPVGTNKEKTWIGPWWHCTYVNEITTLSSCSAITIAQPLDIDQLMFIALTALATFCYLVAVIMGSCLVCCCKSPSAISKWSTVSVFALIAGSIGLGSVIKFAMVQIVNAYIFGFYLAMAGAFLGIFSSMALARVPRPQSRAKISNFHPRGYDSSF